MGEYSLLEPVQVGGILWLTAPRWKILNSSAWIVGGTPGCHCSKSRMHQCGSMMLAPTVSSAQASAREASSAKMETLVAFAPSALVRMNHHVAMRAACPARSAIRDRAPSHRIEALSALITQIYTSCLNAFYTHLE